MFAKFSVLTLDSTSQRIHIHGLLIYEKSVRNIMAQIIYICILRRMLKAGDPVDLKLWTKSGEIQCWRNCIPLRYNFYQGTRQMKLLDSHQMRQARICCIFEINGLEVFL